MRATPHSLEARELAAEALLNEEARDALWFARGEGPGEGPRVNGAGFARDAAAIAVFDAHRATLLGEAALVYTTRRARAAYDAARGAVSLTLRPQRPAVRFDVVASVSLGDANRARREALLKGAEAELGGLRRAARGAVEALREGLAALEAPVVARVGFGAFDPAPTLDATDDLLHELDAAVLRAEGVDPLRLTLGDRLRSLAAPAVARGFPSAIWAEEAARWGLGLGLGGAVGGVRSGLLRSRAEAEGVGFWGLEAGRSAVVAGRPGVAGWYAAEVLGAMSAALSMNLSGGPSPGHRRGLDRAAPWAFHALGRRLVFDRVWLTRALGVEGATRERMMLEALHAEVLRVRRDAALAAYAHAVMSREAELATRFVEAIERAWRVRLDPAWAVVIAGRALDRSSFWGDRWAARARGAAVESLLFGAMRDRFDDDWWRNPSAGDGLRGHVGALYALGPEAWSEGLSGLSMAARYREVMAAITRAK